jgi:hypothetical protein
MFDMTCNSISKMGFESQMMGSGQVIHDNCMLVKYCAGRNQGCCQDVNIPAAHGTRFCAHQTIYFSVVHLTNL